MRRTHTFLAVLSPALLVLTLALWLRGHWFADELSCRLTSHHTLQFTSSDKLGLHLISTEGPTFTHPLSYRSSPAADTVYDSSPWPVHTRSFTATLGWRGKITAHSLFLSWWLLTTTLAILTAITFLIRRKRTLSPTTCRTCGYDLRASPTRCPECGRNTPRQHLPSEPASPPHQS